VQLKRKSNLVHVEEDNGNSINTDSLQPELELKIMEPSEITLQTRRVLDPCECISPQPRLHSRASAVNWVRLQGGEGC
jgi:hypothetical protein